MNQQYKQSLIDDLIRKEWRYFHNKEIKKGITRTAPIIDGVGYYNK